jgi:hypothetical protein
MPDSHLESVPLPPSADILVDAPAVASVPDVLREPVSRVATQPLVEPLNTFLPHLETIARIPGPNSRISLGTWYAEDGRTLDVVGHFVDGGRGLHCNIGTQPFELYLHTRAPYRATGRCWWNNTPFGVVMSRGTAVGAGSGFRSQRSDRRVGHSP